MTTAKVKHSQEFIDLTDGQRFNWQRFMFTASHTGGHLLPCLGHAVLVLRALGRASLVGTLPPRAAAGVRALVTP